MADGDELRVRPGSQAGWTLPLSGPERCAQLGHELGDLCTYENGLIVGYCVRCPARVEIPWFRGGTIAALAKAMATEAFELTNPAPSVVTDLEQLIGLLRDDVASLTEMISLVRQARGLVQDRLERT